MKAHLNAHIPALLSYCLGCDLYKYVDFLISFLCVLIPHFGSFVQHLHTTLQTTTSKFSFPKVFYGHLLN